MKPSTLSERPQSFSRRSRLDRRQQVAGRLRGAALRKLGGLVLGRGHRGAQGGSLLVCHGAHSRTPARVARAGDYVSWDALQGPGASSARHGPRRRFALPRRRGTDPELRRRQAGRSEARRPPAVEAGQGDQGESRLPPDARPPTGAGGGQDAGDGGPATPRATSVPPLGPEAPHQGSGPRGGDDQGGAQARPDRRPRGDPQDQLRALRFGGGEPERRPARQGGRLLRPRIRDPRSRRGRSTTTPRWRPPSTRSRSCAST